MPRTCTICNHPRRAEIDAAVLRSETLRRIMADFSVSSGALVRHRDRHLPVTLAAATQARQVEMGESLLEQAQALRARALGVLEQAERSGHPDTALKAIRELRGILELLAKLDGQIDNDRGKTSRVEVVYVDKAVFLQPSTRPASVATIDECYSDLRLLNPAPVDHS